MVCRIRLMIMRAMYRTSCLLSCSSIISPWSLPNRMIKSSCLKSLLMYSGTNLFRQSFNS